MLPSTRPPASALWTNSFRGAIPRLHVPLPTSRLPPHGDLRTARGRCGSLDLHRRGLTPPAPCQSPGKSERTVSSMLCTLSNPRRSDAHIDDGGADMAYCLQGSILEVCTCKVLCPCWIGV